MIHPATSGTKCDTGDSIFPCFVFTGRYVKVFTACERLTAGQSPGGDNFNVYILRVLMSECRVAGVTSEGLMMIMIYPGQMMP